MKAAGGRRGKKPRISCREASIEVALGYRGSGWRSWKMGKTEVSRSGLGAMELGLLAGAQKLPGENSGGAGNRARKRLARSYHGF